MGLTSRSVSTLKLVSYTHTPLNPTIGVISLPMTLVCGFVRAKESRQRIASEHPEIVSMRNKASAAAGKRSMRDGLGRSAAGKDGVEQGEKVRLDRLRTKVRLSAQSQYTDAPLLSCDVGTCCCTVTDANLRVHDDQVREMLLGHRVRLIDAFRVFDANNSKRLAQASKPTLKLPCMHRCQSGPAQTPHHVLLMLFRFRKDAVVL